MPALVLVIEDDEASLELMRYLLEASGQRVVVARDGVLGLELAERHGPDLVVCDLQLPRADGFQVLKAIRSREPLARSPVVAVTAFAMVGDRTKVLSAGFDGYISKPIDPETFVEELEVFWMES